MKTVLIEEWYNRSKIVFIFTATYNKPIVLILVLIPLCNIMVFIILLIVSDIHLLV